MMDYKVVKGCRPALFKVLSHRLSEETMKFTKGLREYSQTQGPRPEHQIS
jgi:hypothetical protein